MTDNPYHIEGPAIISVSGGRTSGFMLRQIMDAHGGKLPADIIPVFCNTGLEHEATYQFLHEIEQRWTPLVWLEYVYRPDAEEHKHWVKVVKYCEAARRGEPFTQLIKAKGMLPNPVTRFCTVDLKIKTTERYAKSIRLKDWDCAIGIRADEPTRFYKMRGENNVFPIYYAGHIKPDVMKFWQSQPFDLQLPGNDNSFGNCNMCFLKGKAKIAKVMLTNPDAAQWWIEQEERIGHTFRKDRPTYRQMLTQITVQGRMFDDTIEDGTVPCACTD